MFWIPYSVIYQGISGIVMAFGEGDGWVHIFLNQPRELLQSPRGPG